MSAKGSEASASESDQDGEFRFPNKKRGRPRKSTHHQDRPNKKPNTSGSDSAFKVPNTPRNTNSPRNIPPHSKPQRAPPANQFSRTHQQQIKTYNSIFFVKPALPLSRIKLSEIWSNNSFDPLDVIIKTE